MATERSIFWRMFYWIIIFVAIFIILASYFPGVSANTESLQPEITSPANGSVLQVDAGLEFTLTCQVSPTLPGRDQFTGLIHLWWCSPTSDLRCFETTAPLNTTTVPLWVEHISKNISDANSVALSLTEVSVTESAAGQYVCAAWTEGSSQPLKSANVTVEVTVPSTSPGSGTRSTRPPLMPTTAAPLVPNASPTAGPDSSNPTSMNGTTVIPTGSDGLSGGAIAAIVIVVIIALAILLLLLWCFRFKKEPCCKGHRVRARQSKHDSFTTDGGLGGFGMTPVQAEMQPFITRHRCDVFIHHHGTDLTLAEMMRSKLLDQESHLHVTLWSEIAGTGRESRPSTKRLALSLVHSTSVVLLVSWKYLQHESQRFRLALSRIPRKIDAVRHKVVIVRRIEEDRVPQDLIADVAQCLEYNVDTDSKFFWPRFSRAVTPPRDDMLYWRT